MSCRGKGAFEGGLPLPEGYRFTDDATDGESEAVLDYLAGRFSSLLGFAQPQLVLSGEYNFAGMFRRGYTVYDGGAGCAEAILNYSFRQAEFYSNDDGNLTMIRLRDNLACARELGEYPIITAEEARDNGLKIYGVYCVPAVWGRYIANMPVYDGRFN